MPDRFHNFNRRNSPRPSSFSSRRSQLEDFVTRWAAAQNNGLPISRMNDLNTGLFRSSLELQERSKNFVFYDRSCGEVREYPYPLTHKDYPVSPKGFKQYLESRRLSFECYCGLKEGEPQFLEIKSIRPFGHFMACDDCGLYMSIDKIMKQADIFAIYPSENKKGGEFFIRQRYMKSQYPEVKPATSLNLVIKRDHTRAVRRSQRKASNQVYLAHIGRHTASLCLGKSSSALAVEELLGLTNELDVRGRENESRYKVEDEEALRPFSSSPVAVEELLQEFNRSFLKSKNKRNASEALSTYLSREASFARATSPPNPIRFCRFCEVGMAEEYIGDHELECWADLPNVAGTSRPSTAGSSRSLALTNASSLFSS